MRSSNRLMVTRCAIVALLAIAGCGRKPEQAPSAAKWMPPESAPASRAADWLEVAVEPNEGWDADFVARQARAEVEACRDVIERRLGLGVQESAPTLKVEHCHERATFEAAVRSEQGKDLVLLWPGRAFMLQQGNRLVFTRDVDFPERAILESLALLLTRYGCSRVGFTDSLAVFVAGIAVNQLKQVALAERGRVEPALEATRTLRSQDLLRKTCEWGSQPMYPSGKDDRRQDRLQDLTHPFSDAIVRQDLRAQCWFLIYFLATFDAGDDGLVRFGGKSKYDAKLRQLAAIRDPSERAAFCDALVKDATFSAELPAYHGLVLRKVSLGHAKDGVLIPWDEFVNKKGQHNGEPADDLLSTR